MLKEDFKVCVVMKGAEPMAVFENTELAGDFLELIKKVSPEEELEVFEVDFWSA